MSLPDSLPLQRRVPSLRKRLTVLYGDQADAALQTLETATTEIVAKLDGTSTQKSPRWTERDIVLITYGDQLRFSADEDEAKTALAAQRDWLLREGLDRLINIVHLLPFCPYSSDDGFSVIDYLAVDPACGGWGDIAALGERFDLMFDLVLNHMSEHGEWFQAYLRGDAGFEKFFIQIDPAADLSQVTRPRPGPPWKEFDGVRRDGAAGKKLVWSTFSAGETKDQMDLNYEDPRVLAEMMRVLLEYAHRGARIVRLDAVAFLWKVIGTTCMHLPQTHEVVKLARDLLAAVSPRTLVLTETNVPHDENVSYFGELTAAEGDRAAEGDEAHMVYNFSLPPLLLDAFANEDATAIRSWLEDLEDPPPGCTFFNFTASHDGIGLRPLEGLVSDERLAKLGEYVSARGGKVNMRLRPDGTESPYELNITYVDAMAPDTDDQKLHARRFLASQAVMLALRGMPALYFHSLVGTQNDHAGVESSGQNRRINRHKYTLRELDEHLANESSLARRIYQGYCELLQQRTDQPAFHPDAPQEVIGTSNDAVLAFKRTSLDGAHSVTVAVNFSMMPQAVLIEGEPTEIAAGDCVYFLAHQ